MLFFKKKNKKLESEEISETVKNFFYNNKENPSEIRAVNLTKFYGKRKIIEDISYDVKQGEVVGLLGPNGAGKTTLLKLMTRQLQPDSGEVFIAPTVEFNYIDQARVALNPERTVCEEIGEGHQFVNLGDERISIWGYLKRFMFEDERINTQVKQLSGGERARLTLAKILKGGGNFLILDEPTNDLDLVSLRILEEALIDYDGCLVVVSHDRYFLNRVCNHIIAFEADGSVTTTVGDYEYYASKRAERLAAQQKTEKKETAKPKISASAAPKNPPKKLSYKEERELESLEAKIAETEARIGEIETLFSSPDFFTLHGRESPALQKELEDCRAALDGFYARWEDLESKKEQFK